MKTKLTEYQREELSALAEIRQDTVNDDPASGDEFELTPGALDTLIEKLKQEEAEYTEAEKAFLIQEAEMRIDVCEGNRSNEGNIVNGLKNSMQNAINKLSE